ncbi:glycosyltransferase [Nocardioides sp. MAHUQ-72]|uniref:glycosyltransferase n=1 Tax=unclassified Nocardioides TaxID=2615069 RepID=UPI003614BE2E
MRITLVADAFYPAVDGRTRTVKAVADGLVDTGHEVGIVAPGPGLGSYRRSPVLRTGSRLRVGAQVASALAGLAPDVVHVAATGPLGAAARQAAHRLRIPTYDQGGGWLPGVDTDAFNPGLRDPWLHARWSRARSRSGHRRHGGPLVVVGFAGSLEAHHGARALAALATCRGSVPS